MCLKSWNRAQLAEAAGVSRAAVTRWFREGSPAGWVNVETGTLQRLALSLGLSPDLFLEPCPLLASYRPLFLWDALYPDMEGFTKAVVQGRLPALARLTQVLGFNEARRVAGAGVIARFPLYKKFIKPVRRRQLEAVWDLYSRPT